MEYCVFTQFILFLGNYFSLTEVNRQFIVLMILITLILLPKSQMLRYQTIFHTTFVTPHLEVKIFYNHPRWLSGKESARQCRRHRRHGFDPQVRNIPWRRKWQPTPVWWKIPWTEEPTVHGVTKESETEWLSTQCLYRTPVRFRESLEFQVNKPKIVRIGKNSEHVGQILLFIGKETSAHKTP